MELMVSKGPQYLLYVQGVLFTGGGEDQNVIHICYTTDSYQFSQGVINYSLEDHWGILEPKRHHLILKNTTGAFEGGILLMLFLYWNLIKGILQIQKVNSTYSFPNLVTKVYGFATTECIHSTILLLALKSCTKLLHLLSYFSSARLEYCIWIHIQLVIQNPKVIYFFLLSFYSCISSKGTALP